MSSQLPTRPHDENQALPPAEGGVQSVVYGETSYTDSQAQGPPQLQRYFGALRQHKWLILGITVLGTAGGAAATRMVQLEYSAQSTLWIEVDQGSHGRGPIRTDELLRSFAWVDLLKSYVVLDHVVSEQQLYLQTSDRELFKGFALQSRFRPGKYRVEVSPNGQDFVLKSEGIHVQQGRVGAPVGSEIGFEWTPSPETLKPGRTIDFHVLNPRDVAIQLSSEISTGMQKGGNFLRLRLAGTDPVRTASTLNALTDRFVSVAADLKRAKLDQLTAVLDEQRQYAEANLRDAEIQLESFRIQTVTLPSDRGVPVAAGLQITHDPVMSQFFATKVEQEQLRSDREAIKRILAEAEASELSLDALTMVASLQHAPALRAALDEHVNQRAELRALLQRYTRDHPSVQKLSGSIQDLERHTIPQLAAELQLQLLDRESELGTRIGSASAELRQIPPRAIEEARLKRRVSIAENLHSMLKQRYEEARLAAASTIPDVRVLDPAVAPSKPVEDNRLMLIAMGLMGGLGLGVAGVIARDYFDPRVRFPEEVTHGMGLSILGAVPNVVAASRSARKDTTGLAAEALREIRLNLVHAHGAAGPVMLTLTSPGSGDGKSFISSNLALAFADQGYRTLLIDGDTRRGGLHRTFELERVPGLTDYLAGNATLEEILRSTSVPNVLLIPAGTRMANGPELLNSKAMSQLLLKLRVEFGAILVDSPPLGAGIDAFALGTLTQNLALVVRTGTTDRAMATSKLALLDRLPVRLLGAILNGTPTDSGAYRYYSYLAGYEAVEESQSEPLQLEGA